MGAFALAIGAGMLLWPRPASFGWFAYAPLASQRYVPTSAEGAAAIALLVIGVALIEGWIGFRLARRGRS